jgi:hypothetical protein
MAALGTESLDQRQATVNGRPNVELRLTEILRCMRIEANI